MEDLLRLVFLDAPMCSTATAPAQRARCDDRRRLPGVPARGTHWVHRRVLRVGRSPPSRTRRLALQLVRRTYWPLASQLTILRSSGPPLPHAPTRQLSRRSRPRGPRSCRSPSSGACPWKVPGSGCLVWARLQQILCRVLVGPIVVRRDPTELATGSSLAPAISPELALGRSPR
jgi:hypothetical protein